LNNARPSILSLAFPAENPILNRTAGAIVPVFVIIGIALDGLISGLEARVNGKTGQILAWGVAIFLLGWASMQNYHLVFNEYQRSYELSAWNTSDMGQVIQQFGDLFGTTETAWVVAYPHWVDTRLVGINAGEPKRDFAIWPDQGRDPPSLRGGCKLCRQAWTSPTMRDQQRGCK